ncbi:hypothetical protein [Paraburkholderia sp. MM5384-R2]|uniref:hypothetical protein n=1 Tax=Paraburkholderia sp. MM5384-R2 TaxID=2723097 RepID=UPI0016074EE0|nr:hypothetical protein [Paraburkholderia sp. MM5384-R2]MBB5503458.1 hypothetical protein [Paraburkholderia sp. MM5384-R2]
MPDVVKPAVLQVLSDGATLEREFQAILDVHPQHDLWVTAELLAQAHQHWTASLAHLPDLLQEADVPEVSRATMRGIFKPMAQRIEDLLAQVRRQQT